VEERHPLLGADRPEQPVVVAVDHLRFTVERHAPRAQPLVRRGDVVDVEVEGRARPRPFQEQARVTEAKEGQTRRIELRDEARAELVLVKRDRNVEVARVDGDLVNRAERKPHADLPASTTNLPPPHSNFANARLETMLTLDELVARFQTCTLPRA